MDNQKLLKLNSFINKAYECFSFIEFLKLAIMGLHEFVMYDSCMFFCGISRDCSFFKPYLSGSIENYYKKQSFPEREEYLAQSVGNSAGNEAHVYKAADYGHGIVQVANEPRSSFLVSQKDFYIVCMRIVNDGRFLGEIYLHRSKEKPDFDDDDMFVLRLLQPHVSTIFNIIHTITAVKYIETNNQPNIQKGMCMFDEDLSLIGGNVTGVEMLKTPTVFGSSVLYHLKELCLDLLDNQLTIDADNVLFTSKLLKTGNGDLKIEIFAKTASRTDKSRKYIAVLEFCNEEQMVTDYKFKFSKREAEIIDGLIQGKNNAQIAKALDLSENTVKTHIKNIYRKTGAGNRAELTYVLMLNR